MHPTGHTRLPSYARGHIGSIERINGYMVFPDSNAHGRGEDPHRCYSVGFSGSELWGDRADTKLSVSLDFWLPYLEAA
jgi:nitrile hydratase subunit beta